MITVQDDGPGIPPETRARMFEPLFSTKAKGTGLGLTICRQIVEKHGGTIDLVESTRGAAFRLVWPRHTSIPEG
jgi:signal transduction histidine kinase